MGLPNGSRNRDRPEESHACSNKARKSSLPDRRATSGHLLGSGCLASTDVNGPQPPNDRPQSTAPTPARGLAIANMLLTDGTGPLHQAQSAPSLEAAIRDAIGRLDPAAEDLLPM
jgi:hypothetical protein